jgi:hypothetical protein
MKKILALAACLVLQACALPRSLPAATDLKPGASEVVVIGKIELVPPLDPRLEQKTHWNVVGEKRMLSRVLVATGGDHKMLKGPTLDAADFQSSLEVEWGVPFMVRAPRQRTFVHGAVAHLDVLEQEKLWFPGGFYFDVPKDAAAVYIGTLRYYRNDFNAITRVEIVDERKDIASALKGDAPTSSVLQSLLKKVR